MQENTIGETPQDDFWNKLSEEIANSNSSSREYMNVPELAEYIRKSQKYIYNNKANIPHRKEGRTLLFIKSEIDSWIDEQSYL
jgi:predicted DNA-binding transcriptional regulator AlpA